MLQAMVNPPKIRRGIAIFAMGLAASLFGRVLLRSGAGHPSQKSEPVEARSVSDGTQSEATVNLAPSQLNAVRIEPVASSLFCEEREAVGNINYDEDLSVQVFSPYPGRIIKPLAELGDEIQKGQTLYTVDSPDLIQAESSLIGAAATFALTSQELTRVKELYGTNGVSQREIEQATSDQQTADGALKAARDAVRLFGKTEVEIDHIVATRQIDPALVVRSPICGRVTARNAQPGLLVQPGNPPAPYAVADRSIKWMVANANESDSPLFHIGQPVRTKVMAYPGRVFEGRISRIGAAVDPNTHRVMVRCDVADPQDALRPGMLASFVIRVQDPVRSLAIPTTGVVRNGDGTMAAWVTTDHHRFVQRVIKLGLQNNGQYQVVCGLLQGELAVTDGAIFLSNMLQAPPAD
jgi:cobalt-zinc-cadmium efflux system membrane fusion protein